MRATPQTQPLEKMVQNRAGGFGYRLTCWQRAERFLILGIDGVTYYATQQEQADLAVRSIQECLEQDGPRMVRLAADISVKGRGVSNKPCLIALAMALASPDLETRQEVRKVFLDVVRTGSHLLMIVDFIDTLTGWGRLKQSCVRDWYTKTPSMEFQVLKYLQRMGQNDNRWHHRDVLQLCNAKLPEEQQPLLDFLFERVVTNPSPLLKDYLELRDGGNAVEIVKRGRVSWEMVPSEARTDAFWIDMVPQLPPQAMLRNLSVITARGLDKAMSGVICDRLSMSRCTKARLHPLAVLLSLFAYRRGCGVKGHLSWTPNVDIVEHLHALVSSQLQQVESTTEQLAIAIDVSGSMSRKTSVGASATTLAATLALFLARSCKDPILMDFDTTVRKSALRPEMTLSQVIHTYEHPPGGGTDCAAPIRTLMDQGHNPAGVVILSDNETWAGRSHVQQTMNEFRIVRQAPIKLLGVDIVPGYASVMDPDDPLSLACIGYDAGAVDLITHFL